MVLSGGTYEVINMRSEVVWRKDLASRWEVQENIIAMAAWRSLSSWLFSTELLIFTLLLCI